MPLIENDRGETEEEEMDHDPGDSDKSSDDETGSATSEGEDEDTSGNDTNVISTVKKCVQLLALVAFYVYCVFSRKRRKEFDRKKFE